MSHTKKQRGPVRAAFTKIVNDLDVKFQEDPKDLAEIERLFDMLKDRNSRLQILDDNVQVELLNEVTSTENDFTVEYNSVQDYRDKFLDVNRTYRKIMDEEKQNANDEFETASALSSASAATKKKYKLPKLEFVQFEGNPKDWLSFWNQFQSIHEDEDMAPQDKFQYLIQATKGGTRARDVVMSFPATSENYPKVISYMKQRFGNDDILIEVYVRDLLNLVIENSKRVNKSISTLYDQLETQLRALESLGVTKDKFVAMLYPLVESCLPEDILKTWERTRHIVTTDQTDKLTKLMDFMRIEVETEDRVSLAKGMAGKRPSTVKPIPKEENDLPTATDLINADIKSNCVFCGKRHDSRDCFLTQRLSLDEKRNKLRQKRACFCCLQAGHNAVNCASKLQCPICQRKHVVIMCPELSKMKREADNPVKIPTLEKEENEETVENTTLSIWDKGPVLLQILIVKVRCKNNIVTARAIIDTGSMRSYLTKRAAEVLKMERYDTVDLAHSLFGGTQTAPIAHHRYKIWVSDINGRNSNHMEVLETEKIAGNVPRGHGGQWLTELETAGIHLTDIGNENREIHLLLGADVAGTLFTGKLQRTREGPVAMETTLGWTVMGPTADIKSWRNSAQDSSLLVHTLHVTDADIQSLWRLDLLGIKDPVESKSRDEVEKSALQHFQNTVRQNSDGRYEVALPWLECHPPLAMNKTICGKRLENCLRKLQASGYLSKYQAVFDDWEQAGIIERVLPLPLGQDCSYLPHRAVIKETSSTTPVRPVFDASCRSEGCVSINECLERGPNLIELIPDIINRFRCHKIGVVSDIAKAFLQISLRTEDRDFLRFLWWEESSQKTVEYRHARVVFGVSCSPFLLAATINHHLNGIEDENPKILYTLRKSFYVDNCVTSLPTMEETKEFVMKSTDIMKRGKFDLRGWEFTGCKNRNHEVAVLGMFWNTDSDELKLDLRSVLAPIGDEKLTKRAILSRVQKIFDPIGVCAPTTLLPKIMLQELWKKKRSWDEEIDGEIAMRYRKWLDQVPELSKMCFPRWIKMEESAVSLHVFVDASSVAYAACAFIRSESSNNVSVQLVACKVRVAPIQKMSIPRLELMACLIGSRLAENLKNVFGKETACYLWTDSSNAFYWITKNENWAVFVFNRVREIRSLTRIEQWRHIQGELNVADLPSRGCSAHKLIASRWWEGPSWLYKSEETWPHSAINIDEDVVNVERRKLVVSSFVTSESLWYMKSSYRKMIRLIAWLLRWRKPKILRLKELTSDEEIEAEQVLLRLVQQDLHEGSPIVKHTKAFKGSDGLWRVRTKILMRDDLPDFRMPILICGDHPISHHLIKYVHLKRSHCGLQTLMCVLRERFWITKCRQNVRKALKLCGICRRFSAIRVNPPDAALPEERVKDAAVFESTGIDLGGPLYLKDGQKAWFVVFTCAVYRAVHLEVVTSASTEAFLLSLRRFIARRGRPTTIFSDNGKNFEGAANLMSNVDWSRIQSSTAFERIKWIFSPPSAPWWGGFWERVVGMVKKLLRRVLGRARLDLEELQTVMCDVEEIINSRPLTYVSEDTDDFTALTPNCFLRDVVCGEMEDIDQCEAHALNRRGRFRKEIREQLRRRFRLEYLGLLVHRYNKQPHSTLSLGEVVLIEDDLKKRINWKMGRVLELIPGRDGVVRVAKVKTADGQLLRPLKRLFPLECREKVHHQRDDGVSDRACILTTRSGRSIKKPDRY